MNRPGGFNALGPPVITSSTSTCYHDRAAHRVAVLLKKLDVELAKLWELRGKLV
jgi:hypothetical protein